MLLVAIVKSWMEVFKGGYTGGGRWGIAPLSWEWVVVVKCVQLTVEEITTNNGILARRFTDPVQERFSGYSYWSQRQETATS